MNQKKALFVLEGVGCNGTQKKGCFEVDLRLDHDDAAMLSARIHGVTHFQPGYTELDGQHDLDGGDGSASW